MNWSDERYVRLYTRDTTPWLMWPWQARAVLPLLMRRLDRAGTMDLGGYGVPGIAATVGLPHEVVEVGVAALLKDGCVQINGETLVMPNFLEAQEAKQSDKARQAESRARRRDQAKTAEPVTKRDTSSQNVTECHTRSHGVTDGHTRSHAVTPCCAVPCSAEPIEDRAASAAPTTERKPKQPRKPSASEQLVADLEELRLEELPDSQPTDLKGLKPNLLFAQDKAIGRALVTRGDAVFRRAFVLYLADPYWRPKGAPIRGFLSQWERFVAEADAEAPPLVKLKPGEDPYAMPEPPDAPTMSDEEAAARLAASVAKFREQAARNKAEREARKTEVF